MGNWGYFTLLIGEVFHPTYNRFLGPTLQPFCISQHVSTADSHGIFSLFGMFQDDDFSKASEFYTMNQPLGDQNAFQINSTIIMAI